MAKYSDEEWELTFKVNIHAMFYLAKAAIPHMKAGAHPGFSAVMDVSPDAYLLEVNAARMTQRMGPTLRRVTGADRVIEVPRATTYDDFSFFAQHVPGFYFNIGIAPPALRRALHHRDGGCRFPGCGVRFGQGHHIRHWASRRVR